MISKQENWIQKKFKSKVLSENESKQKRFQMFLQFSKIRVRLNTHVNIIFEFKEALLPHSKFPHWIVLALHFCRTVQHQKLQYKIHLSSLQQKGDLILKLENPSLKSLKIAASPFQKTKFEILLTIEFFNLLTRETLF